MRRRLNKRNAIILFGVVSIIVYLFWPMSYDQPALQRFYNRMGERGANMESFYYWLSQESDDFRNRILSEFNLDDKPASGIPRISESRTDQINLVAVVCGDRSDEGITMIKSAILMSQESHLNVIAFVDYNTMPEFGKKLLKLKWEANNEGLDFRYELHKTWFPPESANTWKKMWRPCATQRLFIPSLLHDYDAVMYVDTDSIFLSSVTEFWNNFYKMDTKQFATMTPNDEIPGMGWYNLKSNIPYYGLRGLNAGIMLMNLTRMREFSFEGACLQIYKDYSSTIFLADQDILNTLFYLHPDRLLELSCTTNFRSSHCDCEHDLHVGDGCKCRAAEKEGVSIVHGNQLMFVKNRFPFLKNMYQRFKEHKISRPMAELLEELKNDFASEEMRGKQTRRGEPICFGLNIELLYGRMENYINNLHS